MKPTLIEIITKESVNVYVNLNFILSITVQEPELKILMTEGSEFIVDSEFYKQRIIQAITTS